MQRRLGHFLDFLFLFRPKTIISLLKKKARENVGSKWDNKTVTGSFQCNSHQSVSAKQVQAVTGYCFYVTTSWPITLRPARWRCVFQWAQAAVCTRCPLHRFVTWQPCPGRLLCVRRRTWSAPTSSCTEHVLVSNFRCSTKVYPWNDLPAKSCQTVTVPHVDLCSDESFIPIDFVTNDHLSD